MQPLGEPTSQEELNSDAMVVDAGARSSDGVSAVPEDGMVAGPEDGVVAAPVHTPVAGTRRAAEAAKTMYAATATHSRVRSVYRRYLFNE